MSATRFQRIEAALIVAGVTCLAAYFGTIVERVWYQWRYLSQWNQELATTAPAGARQTQPIRLGILARIEIPRAKVSALVLDGVDSRTLRRAVGHVPGTAYPGETGRIALAAHRDTFFGKLRLLKRGDAVRLIARGRTEVYTVETISVVRPEQTEVLAPTSEPVLTLVTCYPFSFVGPAPERFVVQARRKEMGNLSTAPARANRKRSRTARPAAPPKVVRDSTVAAGG